jgi:hypothetical protein
LVFRGSNGVPGWPYYLLASSNLALPASDWARVATNTFDINGSFLFTNGAGPGAGQFYLLQLP